MTEHPLHEENGANALFSLDEAAEVSYNQKCMVYTE